MFSQLMAYLKQFGELSKEAADAVEECCSLVIIQKAKDLQSIGATCKTIYFINKGLARIYYFKDDNDVTDSFSFENNIIVRVESLFTQKPSRKGIQILEDSEIVAVDANKLFKLYDRFPELERLFRKVFEAAHVATINRIEALQFHNAEERYKMLLDQMPDIIRRVPLKYIASYLGITQVSLSRIRALR